MHIYIYMLWDTVLLKVSVVDLIVQVDLHAFKLLDDAIL